MPQCRFELIRKRCVNKPDVPDFARHNTKHMRDNEVSPKRMTVINYKPLINKTPLDPSTIFTAMCEVEAVSKKAGKK